MPKINLEIAKEIIKLYSESVKVSELIQKYNCRERYLHNIISNKRFYDSNYIRHAKNTKRMPKEEFIEQCKKIHGDRFDYSKVKYANDRTNIIIICKIHGEFIQQPFVHKKNLGCSKCSFERLGDRKRFNNNDDDIDNYLISNNINIKRIDDYVKINRIDDYISSNKKITFECLQCNKKWKTIHSVILRGGGCPSCNVRKNEKIVSNFLEKNCINYTKETIFISGKRIHPDFFISKLNLYIEYNGVQHYKPVKFGSISDHDALANFEKQENRDEKFRVYCKENKYNLLEIDGRIYTDQKLIKFLQDYFLEECK